MQKEFGYPQFDSNGKKVLTGYQNEYSNMLMDIYVKKMSKGERLTISREKEETAVLLLAGEITFSYEGISAKVARDGVFTDDAWCLHFCRGKEVEILAVTSCELLVQSTHNDREFDTKLYGKEDIVYTVSGEGMYGGNATRTVSTIFDYNTAPYSNMVIGEVINNEGNWSSYLPHHHPQPEVYYFKFDRPEGFGASFVGDNVYKITDGSFSAIPGGATHPQAAAPCFKLYICWMIRHLDGDPWTDRIDDERYTWIYEVGK